MTTAVRPKSGLDWAIETPDLVDKDGNFDGTFNSILYNIAAGARFGWTKIPKSLSLTEQALIANFRSLVDHNKPIDLNSENGKAWLLDMGRVFQMYVRAAIADPQVGHFVGRGFEDNEKEADRWQHSGH